MLCCAGAEADVEVAAELLVLLANLDALEDAEELTDAVDETE